MCGKIQTEGSLRESIPDQILVNVQTDDTSNVIKPLLITLSGNVSQNYPNQQIIGKYICFKVARCKIVNPETKYTLCLTT